MITYAMLEGTLAMLIIKINAREIDLSLHRYNISIETMPWMKVLPIFVALDSSYSALFTSVTSKSNQICANLQTSFTCLIHSIWVH